MKKKFDTLLYIGLFLIGGPIIFVSILIVLPIFSKNSVKNEVEEHVIVYDTVRVKKTVKFYDTIPVEKIKWIEKVKPDTIN